MVIELKFYPSPYGRSISIGEFEVDKESDADDLCEVYGREYNEEVFWEERSLFNEIKEGMEALKGKK